MKKIFLFKNKASRQCEENFKATALNKRPSFFAIKDSDKRLRFLGQAALTECEMNGRDAKTSNRSKAYELIQILLTKS